MSRTLCLLFSLVLLPLVADRAAGQSLTPRGGGDPIAIRSHRVEAWVEDGLARTSVRHTFVNHGTRDLEAVYRFPIPKGAALVDVAMETAGERHEGLLAERKQARRVYNDIVRSKKDPALVEQVGAEMFRLSVYPVVPNVATVVELTWIERVTLSQGAQRYVYPLAHGGRHATTEHDFSALVHLSSSVPVTAVTCTADDAQIVRQGDRRALVSFERTRARLDQDLVVTSTVKLSEPSVVVRTSPAGPGEGWFQVTITPPVANEDQLVPRDVLLVLDTSGSMQGEKLVQALASAEFLLDGLRAQDRVNVITFSSAVDAFAPEPVPATPETVAELRAFVRGLSAQGSTALGDALELVASMAPTAGRVRTIALLTDGNPTVGETRTEPIVGLGKRIGEVGLQLNTFGVGEDLDAGLLRGLASAGNGEAELFRPGSEIQTRLTRFLVRTSAPVMGNFEVSFEGARVFDQFPRSIPSAYLGEQVTIVGRYRDGGPGKVIVETDLGDVRAKFTRTHDFGQVAPAGSDEVPNPGVRHLFARAKLDFLEQAKRLRSGLSDEAYYAALDRGAYSTSEEIVQEIIQVSLEHGVQSPYTSFLVLLPEDKARLTREQMADLGVEEEETEEEPILQDFEVSDHNETDTDEEFETTEGDPGQFSDSPFDDKAFNDVIGIGGGSGGKFGGRFGGRRNLKASGGSGFQRSLKDGLEWLKNNQQPNGSWQDEVESTGMALLAFLGDGNTLTQGVYKRVVLAGVKWLRSQQDSDSGKFGDALEDHLWATLAMAEAYQFSKSPLIKRTVQSAVDALADEARADGAWSAPSARWTDHTWTCFVIQVLVTARDAGLQVDAALLPRLEGWLGVQEVTDPVDSAATILSLQLLESKEWLANLELLTEQTDYPSEYYDRSQPLGTFVAEFAMERAPLRKDRWGQARRAATLFVNDHQRKDAEMQGSWDPGTDLDRVETTALHLLFLEVPFRHR